MNCMSYLQKTKEQIIYDMCMTYRHDYGLHKEDLPEGYPNWGCGTTEMERKIIYNQMSSLYEHYVAPSLKLIEETLRELPVGHIPSHTPDSIPERVRYYVQEFAKLSYEMDKLIDTFKPVCKQCLTELIYFDGWNCECKSAND
jgi:hypothetical protein